MFSNFQVLHWNLSDVDLPKLYPKKDLKDGHTKTDGKSTSKLALLVANSHNQPKNPFAHYGKFDGQVWHWACSFKKNF